MRECGIVLTGLRAAANILGTVVAVSIATTALPSSANAALVTLESHLSYRDLTNGGSWQHGGLFVFTYENSTADSDPDNPFVGLYNNALTAGRITLGDRLFEIDTGLPNKIRVSYGRGEVYAARIFASFLQSGSNTPYSLYLPIENGEIRSDSLSVLIGLRRADDLGTQFTRMDGQPQDFSSGMWPDGLYPVVPSPPAVYLFGSALGLIGVLRRNVGS